MVASMMLPAKAFAPAPENEAVQNNFDLADPTPDNYGCASPLSRWLGLPCSNEFCQPETQEQQQQPAMPAMQPCAVLQPQMVTPFQPPQAQPTWVYMMPVAGPVPAAPQMPQMQPQQTNLASSDGSADFVWPVADGLLVGKSHEEYSLVPHHDVDNDNDSNSSGPHCRLSASAARRRRRQRAAAYAKAEQVQRSVVEASGQGYPTSLAHGKAAQQQPAIGITSELCKQLKQQIAAGGEAQAMALATLRHSVRAFTFDSAGCRVVQDAIEKGPMREAAELVKELKGSVRKAAASPFGNYVIQKVIEVLPHTDAHFIVEELLHHAPQTARHQYGCRIMCRLLEHSLENQDTIKLFDQLLVNVGALCRHEFAHYVMESMLEHGTEPHKALLARCLEQELIYNSANRSMMFVLEAAVRFLPQDVAARLQALKQQNNTSYYYPTYENPACGPQQWVHQQQTPASLTMEPVCVY